MGPEVHIRLSPLWAHQVHIGGTSQSVRIRYMKLTWNLNHNVKVELEFVSTRPERSSEKMRGVQILPQARPPRVELAPLQDFPAAWWQRGPNIVWSLLPKSQPKPGLIINLLYPKVKCKGTTLRSSTTRHCRKQLINPPANNKLLPVCEVDSVEVRSGRLTTFGPPHGPPVTSVPPESYLITACLLNQPLAAAWKKKKKHHKNTSWSWLPYYCLVT